MNIEDIKRRFDLLKKVNNESYCLVSELAKEMKVRKTDLMQYIDENEKLFSLGTLEKRMRNGIKKNMGLALKGVYLNPSDNPSTDEWLEKQVKEYMDYIHVSKIEYYGHIQGHYIEIDDNNCKRRENIWRNTKEKVYKLVEQGIVEKYSFCVGSIGDSYNKTCDYALLGDWKKKLSENGWRFNDVCE